MEWYVLNYDFNSRKVIQFNIFRSVKFADGVDALVKEGLITYQDFVDKLDSLAKYCFLSKREYEISVGDLYEQDPEKYEKTDVYEQLKMNMKTLADYIIVNKFEDVKGIIK